MVVEEVVTSWRRVASTHDLQELLQHGPVPFSLTEDATPQPIRWFSKARLYGVLLLMLCFTSCFLMGTSVVTKLMPPAQQPTWVRTIQDDWYYCMAVPGILPMTLVTVGDTCVVATAAQCPPLRFQLAASRAMVQ